MGLDEITNILKRELRQFDHREKVRVGETVNKSTCSELRPYEDIETPSNPLGLKSPVTRSYSSASRTGESVENKRIVEPPPLSPKLPPRESQIRPPEPPPKTLENMSGRRVISPKPGSFRKVKSPNPSPIQSPTLPRRSPKPLPRTPQSPAVDIPNMSRRNTPPENLSDDDESDGMSIYDKPTVPAGPIRRTSFLHGDGSSAKIEKLIGTGSPSRISTLSDISKSNAYPSSHAEERSRSLPFKQGGESPKSCLTPKSYNTSLTKPDTDDPEQAKVRTKPPLPSTVEENAYSDIPEKDRQRILASSVQMETSISEKRKVFESAGQTFQGVQTKLTKAAQTGGAKATAAASQARIVMSQLKTRLSGK